MMWVGISSATATAAELTGYMALEGRTFLRGAVFPEQEQQAVSFILEPEIFHETEDRHNILTFVPFVRLDAQDDRRTHADIRELNWLHIGDSWDVRLGIGKVFWGVAESRHLVNIINQDDAIEDIDGEDKLGQPMINAGILRDWGALRLFVLPGFRERTFPGKSGRLRGELLVDRDNAVYESALKERHVDVAARYTHTVGIWDVGLSHFWGTSREPRLVAGADANGNAVLIPHYDIINQTGLDLQATIDAWLLKFESIFRSGQGRDFAAVVAGFEYTFFNIRSSGADIGILAEYLWDDRDSFAPDTAQDNDIFFGSRLAFNDQMSSELLAGAMVDMNHGSTAINIEGSRRVAGNWRIEFDLRAFGNISRQDILHPTRHDDFFQLRVSRFF